MGCKNFLGPQFLILNSHGGVRAEDGSPVALGYHTGHWEVGLLVKRAAEEIKNLGGIPFAAHVSDPCDGRSQGTTAMFDSLAYRNDASMVMRRLARSLPTAEGIMGIATCDKSMPAMMMALAEMKNLPIILVPGGVTLSPSDGEDAGSAQSVGIRYAQGVLEKEKAEQILCRTCATPGGGCQFWVQRRPRRLLEKHSVSHFRIPLSPPVDSLYGWNWASVRQWRSKICMKGKSIHQIS